MIFDVVGFAAINEDRIRYLGYSVKETEVFSRRPPEELKNDEKTFLGGSVVNTLVGLAKFGFSVATLGKLGNDETGNRVQTKLKTYGIDFFGDIDEVYNSSVAKIEVGSNKQRKIVIHPGVNDRIEWKDIEPFLELVRSSKLFHSATFACAYSISSLKTQIKLAEKATKKSLSFGMLYCDLLDKEPTLIESLLKATDILILNEEEIKRIGKETENYKEAARNLMKKYEIETIAVTLGDKGSCVFGENETHFIKPRSVKVIDTTGAGDAYSAGFLAAYLNSKDLKTCGLWGNRNAENCIGTYGAVDYQIPKKLV
ncbi:MAG: carbohydrate kinase family protein [Promethearchaeota archaeon]